MAIKTNIGLRQRIIKLYNSGKKIPEIMQELNLTYFQVYNTISGRVKLTRAPRSDKGKKRGLNNLEEMEVNNKNLSDFQNIDEFLQYQLMQCLTDLANSQMTASERVKLLKDISAMQRNIEARKLETYMKRPDAVLIIRIMRRFKPELTDDEIIRIYNEEYEKMVRDIA
jgi:hypothetical protein